MGRGITYPRNFNFLDLLSILATHKQTHTESLDSDEFDLREFILKLPDVNSRVSINERNSIAFLFYVGN